MSHNYLINEFCSNVRKLRQRSGLSIPELAARTSLSPETLEQLEHNILPDCVYLEDVVSLANALECDFKQFFGRYWDSLS